jgi:hypothetical protein
MRDVSADARPRSRIGCIGIFAVTVAALAVAGSACSRPNPVYCDEDTPCADPGMACNVDRRECVPTGLDGNTCAQGACPAGVPICDEVIGQCRGCLSGSEGDIECESLDPETPFCSAGVCVQCERPRACPSPAPACTDHVCVPCEEGPAGDAICDLRDSDAPYCLEGACVECREASDCGGDTPICEASEGVCRGCERGIECESGICDTTSGACADEEDILYVDGDDGEDGEGCGAQTDPCATISGDEGALAQADGDRAFIFVRARDGAGYRERISLDRGYVAIVGEGAAFGEGGARLEHSGTAPIVDLSGGARLWLEGVRLLGDLDIGESGIECSASELNLERVELAGFGVHAVEAEGCDLFAGDALFRASREDQLRLSGRSEARIHGSRITGGDALGVSAQGGRLELHRSRVEGNERGGIDAVDSALDLVNNVIVDNGSVSASALGGVRVRHIQTVDEDGRFAFNTVARNHASDDDGRAHGVDCDDSELRATSNIVHAGFGGLEAVSEGCGWTWVFSNIHDGVEIDPDSGNFSQDPLFADPSGGDYRIDADSPCVGRGEPGTGIAEDIELSPRPADNPPACGAYEP